MVLRLTPAFLARVDISTPSARSALTRALRASETCSSLMSAKSLMSPRCSMGISL